MQLEHLARCSSRRSTALQVTCHLAALVISSADSMITFSSLQTSLDEDDDQVAERQDSADQAESQSLSARRPTSVLESLQV